MKISIVTLSFNQKRFLNEALNSVLDQGYQHLEYIVVDPGSTDGSRDVLERYRSRLAALILEPDKGAADGLNKGFAIATGEILAFLNADDRLLPLSLSAVSEFFQNNPAVDLAFGDGFIIDAHGNRKRHIKAHGFTLERYLHAGCSWLQQATFFRRSAFQQSPGFNIANRTCWDGELFAGMVKRGARVGYLNRDLAEFRIHGTSISGSGANSSRYREDTRRIFHELLGRRWTPLDEGVRTLYRIEGRLRRIIAGRR